MKLKKRSIITDSIESYACSCNCDCGSCGYCGYQLLLNIAEYIVSSNNRSNSSTSSGYRK